MRSSNTALTRPSARPVAELHQVRKTYGQGQARIDALDGVDLLVLAGDMLAITGPSGSGKSTLLHMLGALDRPTSGRVLIDGTDVSRAMDETVAAIRCTRIGFVFQGFHLDATLTAEGNVALPMVLAGVPRRERHRRAMGLLERVGLGDRAAHRPHELSGGQRQRVAIARALANDPALILADEPTGALDSASSRRVLDLLERLNAEGRTIVLVTHDEAIAARAQRRVAVLDGRISEA